MRAPSVLAATLTVTVPFPVPVAPPVTVIHPSWLTAFAHGIVEDRHLPVPHDDERLLFVRVQPADEDVRARTPPGNRSAVTVTSTIPA